MATVNFIRNAKQSRGALGGVKRYVEQEKKTLYRVTGQRLVSGQNCSPQLADKEFLATRDMYRKDSPRYFYHYTQSFHPDEPVTGELAHKIAKEFAARAWPENEVLIATHVDAEHIHSHFIVNAVCYKTGKMLHQGPNTLARLRQISDELCQAHGLSVLPSRQKKQQGMSAREYRSAVKGESWKFQLMNAIDLCMRRTQSREEFIREMERRGYQVRWEPNRKAITYTTPKGMKCRDDRLHSDKYRKGNMEHEFRIREEIIYGRAHGEEPSHTSGEHTSSAGNSQRCDPVPGAGSVGQAGSTDAVPGEEQFQSGRIPATTDRDLRTAAHPDASRGTDESSDEAMLDNRTGWEEERAAALSAGVGAAPTQSRMAVGNPGLGGVVGTLVQLGHRLEQSAEANDPVAPITGHVDRKLLAKERKKKIALGQKPDDHQDEQTWQQTM